MADQYILSTANNIPIRISVTGTSPLAQTARAIGLQLEGSPTITWYEAAAWASGADTNFTREVEIIYGTAGIGVLATGIYKLWQRVGVAADARIIRVGNAAAGFDNVVVFTA